MDPREEAGTFLRGRRAVARHLRGVPGPPAL